jgi:hypothetical protein
MAYVEKSQDDLAIRPFNCSAGFVRSFKKRNQFSSRHVHLNHRPPRKKEERAAWISRLIALLHEVPDPTRFVTVDEFCWRVYPGALEMWAPRSSQNVTIIVKDNEKDSFTVIAAIAAARTKLPLCLIDTGKTPSVEESHFEDIGYHHADYSESGWQTAETFTHWLNCLRGLYDDGEPICLVLDCYSVHLTEAMRRHAGKLGIHFLFILPGLTDELQPLDRFVFSAMKATCRQLYRIHGQSGASYPMPQRLAAGFLIRVWEGISP